MPDTDTSPSRSPRPWTRPPSTSVTPGIPSQKARSRTNSCANTLPKDTDLSLHTKSTLEVATGIGSLCAMRH